MEGGVRTESLSALIEEIRRALIPATTESEIERCVCERLADSPHYESAWTGSYDAATEVVVPETVAGRTTDSPAEIPLDGDAEPQRLLRRALRTCEVQVGHRSGDARSDEQRPDALPTDSPSSAAIPLVHDDASQGVLFLSTDRPDAFDALERETLFELGEDVAAGLAAVGSSARTRTNQVRTEWDAGFMENALDDLPDVFFCFDTAGRFVRWSDELEAVTGYSGDEIAEMSPVEFFRGDDVEKATTAIGRVYEQGRSKEELALVTKDGEGIPYEFTGVRIDDADGEPVGIAGIGRDITEQRLLHDTIRSASEAETFEDAAQAAIERVCEATGWEYGEAWTPAPDGSRMERTDAAYVASDELTPFERASEATTIPSGVGLPGRVRSSRKSHWIADVAADETAETFLRIETAREVGVRSAVGVPITNDGEVVAALCFYARERWSVDQHQIAVVKSVAAELATVLAQKRAQDEISRQRDQLATLTDRLLETIPTGVVTFGADGELTQCNRRATEILGLSEDEVGSLLPRASEWEVVDSEGRPIPESGLPFERVRSSAQPVLDVEIGLKPPDGETIWLLVNGAPVSDGSTVSDGSAGASETVFAFKDITERKRRQQERRRVIQALETAREGISLLDEDGEFIYVNDAYADIFDYQPEEMIGEHWETLGIENDPEYFYDEVLPNVLEEGQWTGTTHCVRSDESTFVAEHSLTHTEQDELVCVVRDVTEQQRRRRNLRETKAQLEAAAEAGSVGTWTWNLRENELVTDASLARLFGVDPEVATSGAPIDMFISAIHDDDRRRVERKLEEAIESCGEYEAEYRVRDEDGDVRWIVERGHVESDEGEPVKFLGAAADITQRKRAEQELRKSEKQLQALIDLLPVAVFVAEKDGRIVEWNEAAKEIWGGEVAESESVAEYAAYDGWWADTGEPVEPEEWALARALRGEEVTDPDVVEIEGFDGERRTVLNHGVPVRDEDGEVNRAVVTLIDITEREEREQRLQQQNERLESFASMLAHELRNPLSIAQIYLQQAAVGDEASFEEVETALDRMEKMIDILLVLTRGGDTVIDPEPVALDEMATEAWSDVGARTDRLRVETDLTLAAEPHHLRHMLENLFRNAVEHGDDDVTVRVGALDGETDGFYVEDDGRGIPEDERGRIFEAGYTTDADGIGLGLTFIAQLGDAYGWEYDVAESAEGGARFEFRNVDDVDAANAVGDS